jgi:hypothetical protein
MTRTPLPSWRRLAVAKAAEAVLADQAEARELAEELEKFIQAGNEIDATLETLVEAPKRMQRALQRMRDLGCQRPDHRQWTTLSFEALQTALLRDGLPDPPKGTPKNRPPKHTVIPRPARDDDVLPAFRLRCLYVRAAQARQTVRSAGMIGTTTRE